MSDNSSDHEDLKALWQGQSQEHDPMSLQHIQAISRRLDRNEQRGTIIMMAAAAFAFFIVGQMWQKSGDVLMRGSFGLYGIGVVGCAILYYRQMHVPRDPAEPGGLFLRRRLERRLRMLHGRFLIGLLPLVPWIISLIVLGAMHRWPMIASPHPTGPQGALRWLPVIILAAVWIATMLIIVPRQIRKFRRDLDELDAAMK
jgi:hypothetical protein